ncbi:MAG TPA: helix-turn-helix transcriptional regulator [Pseudonocardiaceae bacterium]
MTVLLREAIGERLRRTRTAQHRTLREVSRAARVSLGYLSEVERGRKEPSSELLAAICDALELELSDLLTDVASDIRGAVAPVPAATAPREPVEKVPVPAGGARAAEEKTELVPSVLGEELSDLRPVLTHRLPAPIREPRNRVVVAA